MLLYDVDEFRASENWPYAISAGCVVYRESKKGIEVLLLSRSYDHDYYSAGDANMPSYHLPKGHLNFNETLEACALRETTEESGAVCKIIGYLGTITHDFNHPRHRNTTDKTIHYFAAKWISDTQKIDNEHDDREWIMLGNAEKLMGQPNPKEEDEIIRRFKKFLEKTK